MKIETLIKDIRSRLSSDEPYPTSAIEAFSKNLASVLIEKLSRGPSKPSLRMSNLGQPCDRKLWFSINRPEKAEPLPASARLKFLIGDIWEQVLLFLADASGHKVEKQQQRVELNGVVGHIDAVIDGELVDAKSASTLSFEKFNEHRLAAQDDFGYITQINGYLSALAADDPSVRVDRAHFLVGDKTRGHITLDTHERSDTDYSKEIDAKRKMLAWPLPPARAYNEIVEDNGNKKLSMPCGYCAFKEECWGKLRVYKYAKGPVFFTHVAKTPTNKYGPLKELTLNEAQED